MSDQRASKSSGPAAGTNVLDPQVLHELRELGGADDAGLLGELIELFLADAPKRLEEIRRGFETGDIKLLERAAHTLKSSSANLGATTLSGLCRNIEHSARTSQLTPIRELLERSQQHWPEVEAALRAVRR